MSTTITTDERLAMRDSVRRLLSEVATEANLRRVMATETGYDPEIWKALADLGALGLLVETDYGGIGGGPMELELLMEEVGGALLSTPWMSSGVLAAGLLSASKDENAKQRLLPSIASGERIVTVALAGEQGGWTLDEVAVTATNVENHWSLSGIASFVTFAGVANTMLVAAKTAEGVQVFEVDPDADGLTITPLRSFDMTLRLANLTFEGVVSTPIAGADAVALEKMLDLARIALAGEQAGGARRSFDLTVDYIKTRIQFGRPVGGFQALKHMAADLLIEVESATSAARQAAAALDAESQEAQVLISLAAFACADAFSAVAAASIQMHGGIGFTWEHPAHLYLRRARADAQMFGGSAYYRERYLNALEKAA